MMPGDVQPVYGQEKQKDLADHYAPHLVVLASVGYVWYVMVVWVMVEMAEVTCKVAVVYYRTLCCLNSHKHTRIVHLLSYVH